MPRVPQTNDIEKDKPIVPNSSRQHEYARYTENVFEAERPAIPPPAGTSVSRLRTTSRGVFKHYCNALEEREQTQLTSVIPNLSLETTFRTKVQGPPHLLHQRKRTKYASPLVTQIHDRFRPERLLPLVGLAVPPSFALALACLRATALGDSEQAVHP